MNRKWILLPLIVTFAAVIGIFAYVYQGWGIYGIHGILRNGGNMWTSTRRDDPKLSLAVRLALSDHVPAAVPGPMHWREVEPGFEVAELPVLANGQEVDRIYLNRVDPLRFDLKVGNAPDNDRDLSQWQAARPKAVLIANGSYFSRHGRPDTPVIIDSQPRGPARYTAHAGVLIAAPGRAHVVDLGNRDWHGVVSGAAEAMVSYPLLIGEDGQSHVSSRSRWLANRTFVAEDHHGHIIIGSTQDAFFSLDRLADFLRTAPLDLKTALNLDGGPIADLGVRLHGYSLTHYAHWEVQGGAGDEAKMLTQPLAGIPDAMPMVLMVERRN